MPFGLKIAMKFGKEKMAEFEAVIVDLAKELSDFTPVWPSCLKIAGEGFAANFASKSGLSGTWPPLAPATLKEKLRKGYPADILVRTRSLKESVTKIGSQATSNQLIISEKLRLGFGVRGEVEERSYYHDRPQGVRGKRREHLSLSNAFQKRIFSEIGRWTYEQAGRIWKGER